MRLKDLEVGDCCNIFGTWYIVLEQILNTTLCQKSTGDVVSLIDRDTATLTISDFMFSEKYWEKVKLKETTTHPM